MQLDMLCLETLCFPNIPLCFYLYYNLFIPRTVWPTTLKFCKIFYDAKRHLNEFFWGIMNVYKLNFYNNSLELSTLNAHMSLTFIITKIMKTMVPYLMKLNLKRLRFLCWGLLKRFPKDYVLTTFSLFASKFQPFEIRFYQKSYNFFH